MRTVWTLIGLTTWMLAACGGGSGGSGGSSGGAPVPGTLTNAPSTNIVTSMSELQPATTMNWQTNSSTELRIHAQRANGQDAANASVRVFRLNWYSPQDGARLDEPVAVALLDAGVADTSGQLTLPLRLPAYIDEVLLVISEGDAVVKHVVDLTQSGRDVNVRLPL